MLKDAMLAVLATWSVVFAYPVVGTKTRAEFWNHIQTTYDIIDNMEDHCELIAPFVNHITETCSNYIPRMYTVVLNKDHSRHEHMTMLQGYLQEQEEVEVVRIGQRFTTVKFDPFIAEKVGNLPYVDFVEPDAIAVFEPAEDQDSTDYTVDSSDDGEEDDHSLDSSNNGDEYDFSLDSSNNGDEYDFSLDSSNNGDDESWTTQRDQQDAYWAQFNGVFDFLNDEASDGESDGESDQGAPETNGEECQENIESENWGLGRIYSISPQRPAEVHTGMHVAPGGHPGEGTTIYIVSTGIDRDHAEIQRRVVNRWDAFHKGVGSTLGATCAEDDCGIDEDGKGTFVASIAAGKTVGVATGANIVSVKVEPFEGLYEMSAFVQGLEWACSPLRAGDLNRRIIMVSTHLLHSRAIKMAFDECADNKVIVVTAAGDGGRLLTRDRAPLQYEIQSNYNLNVGASTINDYVYSMSNYGSAVNIFAPGRNIVGARPTNGDWDDGESGESEIYTTTSSTGAAAAHVAGAVAVLRSRFEAWDGKDIVKEILQQAHKKKLRSLRNQVFRETMGNRPHEMTPNRLLFMLFDPCIDIISSKECKFTRYDVVSGSCFGRHEYKFELKFGPSLPDMIFTELSMRRSSIHVMGGHFMETRQALLREGVEIEEDLGWGKWSTRTARLFSLRQMHTMGPDDLHMRYYNLIDQLERKTTYTTTEQISRLETELMQYGMAFLLSIVRAQNTVLSPQINVFEAGYQVSAYSPDGVSWNYNLFSEQSSGSRERTPGFMYFGTTISPEQAHERGGLVAEHRFDPDSDTVGLREKVLHALHLLVGVGVLETQCKDAWWQETIVNHQDFLIPLYETSTAARRFAGNEGFVYVIDMEHLSVVHINKHDQAFREKMSLMVDDVDLIGLFIQSEYAVNDIIKMDNVFGCLDMKTGLYHMYEEEKLHHALIDTSYERPAHWFPSICPSAAITDAYLESAQHEMKQQAFEMHIGLWGISRISPDHKDIKGCDLPLAIFHPLPKDLNEGYNGDHSVIWIVDIGIIEPHNEFRKRSSPSTSRIIKRYNADLGRELDITDHHFGAMSNEWRATHVAGTAAGLYAGLATDAEIVSVALGAETNHLRGINWMCDTLQSSKEGHDVNMAATKKHVIILAAEISLELLGEVVRKCSEYAIIIRKAGDTANGCDTVIPEDLNNKVITVGSMNHYDEPSENYALGRCIDVFAPGELVASALPMVRMDGECEEQHYFVPKYTGESKYGICSGTAMAAAHVAGVVANQLSLLHFATFSAQKIKHMVIAASLLAAPVLRLEGHTENINRQDGRWTNTPRPLYILADYTTLMSCMTCIGYDECRKYRQDNVPHPTLPNDVNGHQFHSRPRSGASFGSHIEQLKWEFDFVDPNFEIPVYEVDFRYDDYLLGVGCELRTMFEQQMARWKLQFLQKPEGELSDFSIYPDALSWNQDIPSSLSELTPNQRGVNVMQYFVVTVRVRDDDDGILDIAAWPAAGTFEEKNTNTEKDEDDLHYVDYNAAIPKYPRFLANTDTGPLQLANRIMRKRDSHTGQFFGFGIYVDFTGTVMDFKEIPGTPDMPTLIMPPIAVARQWASCVFRLAT